MDRNSSISRTEKLAGCFIVPILQVQFPRPARSDYSLRRQLEAIHNLTGSPKMPRIPFYAKKLESHNHLKSHFPQKLDKPVQISVVFPAYNEAEYLEVAVERVTQTLEDFTHSFEIVIAEDGSTDGTAERAEEIALRFSHVKRIHMERRLGRGTALGNAFRQCNGDVFVYMDLDLATDLKYLKPLVEAITVENYDLCLGSRNLPESKVKRTLVRSIASKSYNFIVRLVLGSKISDHQCGFKAFKRETLIETMKEVHATHWFWDTEILIEAVHNGYKIKEIPVEWKSRSKTKVNLFRDSCSMGKQVVDLWWQLRKEDFRKKTR
jgi:glycosyltransferase involved in cell wall biosynthesis